MAVPIRKYNPGFLSDEELVALFCVRTTEFGLLLEALRQSTDSSNQHQLVIGPRGSGKTTLLLRVAVEVRRDPLLAAHCFPIVFAEESYEISTMGEFWLECLTLLATQVPSGDNASDLHRTVHELRAIRDDRTLGDRCLGAILDFADCHGKRLLLLIENLNMLFRDMTDRDAGWRLRKILQTEPRIIAFASATTRFAEIDHPDRALYELFQVHTLRPLNTRGCEILWQAVTGRRSAPKAIQSLRILTGGSPRLLMVLARFGAARSFRQLMADLLDLVDDHTEYFRGHLESLAAQERRVYLALATLWKPAITREIAIETRLDTNTCSAQLARLIDRGVVHVTGGSIKRKQYYLTERLYNIYYLLRRNRGPDRLVEALIRFMEAYYSPNELREVVVAEVAHPADDDDKEGLMRPLYKSALAQLRASPVLPADSATDEHSARALLDKIGELIVEARLTDALATCEEMQRRFEGHEAPEVVQGVARALVNKAAVLGMLNRLPDALAACDEVVERFGESSTPVILESVAMALLNKGVALDRFDRPSDVVAVCDQVLERFGDTDAPGLLPYVAMALLNKGAALTALNQLEDALATCDRLVERFGGSEASAILEMVAMGLLNRGSALSKLHRPADVVATCDEVVERFGSSDDPATLRFVAMALVKKSAALNTLGRAQDALDVCDMVVERFLGAGTPTAVDESVAMALVNKGVALSMLTRSAEALATCDQVVERFGESDTAGLMTAVAMALMSKGTVLVALKRPQDALATYGQVVERFGKSGTPSLRETVAGALLKMGIVLTTLNQLHDAVSAHDQVVERFGDSDVPAMRAAVAKALVNKGAAFGELNQPADALDTFSHVVERFGQDDAPVMRESVAKALMNRGAALSALDRRAEALVAYDKVVERFGGSETPGVREWVAMALVNKGALLGNSERALEAVEACNEVLDRVGKNDVPVMQEVAAMALMNRAAAISTLEGREAGLAVYDEVLERFATSEVRTGRVVALVAEALLKRATITGAERDIQEGLALLGRGTELARGSISALIELSVDLGPERMGALVGESAAAPFLLPLTTALERELGRMPRVAQEVDEVADDIQRQLEEIRKRARGRGKG